MKSQVLKFKFLKFEVFKKGLFFLRLCWKSAGEMQGFGGVSGAELAGAAPGDGTAGPKLQGNGSGETLKVSAPLNRFQSSPSRIADAPGSARSVRKTQNKAGSTPRSVWITSPWG